MARFQYDKLSEHQLRIAIGLLNQEEAVVEVLEEAAERKVAEALGAFGISGDGNVFLPTSGASGGARKKSTKRTPQRVGNVFRADDKEPEQKKRTARAPRISADQLASRQLQGRYLAAIRSVPKSKRGKYKSIAQAGDRQAAVTAIYRDYPPTPPKG